MQTENTSQDSIRQSLRGLLGGGNFREILRNWNWILTFTRRHWLGDRKSVV